MPEDNTDDTGTQNNTDSADKSKDEKGSLLTNDDDSKEDDSKEDDSKEDDSKEDDSKEDDSKEDDSKEDDSKEDDSDGAPEKYEDFSTPDGIEMNDEVLTGFTELAKQKDLNQEDAQKFLDLGVAVLQDFITEQNEGWKKQVTDWEQGIQNDKEFGRKQFTETLEGAKRALRKFGSPELNKFLNSGLGSHPELIKAWARVDKATKEDKVVDGEKTETTEKDIANTMYPDHK